MKMVNKTNLNTKQLKAFVRQVAIHEQLTQSDIKQLQVFIIYRRRSSSWKDNYVTGYAYYNTPKMYLKFVKGVLPDKSQMAKTVAHELVHTQGVHHGSAMNNKWYGWAEGWQEHWAWAEKLPVTMNASRDDIKPSRNQKLLSKVSHCLKMMIVWERKSKIAKTKQLIWKRKLSYYQKQGKMAAMMAPVEVKPVESNPVPIPQMVQEEKGQE